MRAHCLYKLEGLLTLFVQFSEKLVRRDEMVVWGGFEPPTP